MLKKTLSFLHTSTFCARFGQIGSIFLAKKMSLNFVNVFSLFGYHFSVDKDVDFIWRNWKFPSPKDILSQDWFKLVQVVWRRNFLLFFLFCHCIFFYYHSFGKGASLHLNKVEFLHPGYYVPCLVEIWWIVPVKIFF